MITLPYVAIMNKICNNYKWNKFLRYIMYSFMYCELNKICEKQNAAAKLIKELKEK